MLSRRIFVSRSALGLFSLAVSQSFLGRSLRALASDAKQSKKVLLVIFQRGAADGLSIVPPIGDADYYKLRPNIGLKMKDEFPPIALDGHFGLNPGMAALKPFWDEKHLAIIHQAGSPNLTRSHFDAQDFMESGTPGVKKTDDGYLNRAMQLIPEQRKSNLRAVALQTELPRSLRGKFPAISMDSIHDFGIQGMLAKPQMVSGFESMYQQATDQVFRGVGQEVFDALQTVHKTDEVGAKNKNDLYPKSQIARHLKEISELIKADIGLQLAATDVGGWDTHVNQGNGKGQMSDRLKELAEGLAAFAKDLGPRFADVMVVTMTEFGRTVKENGNRGTDHGHGSVMMVLGGGVRGGKVYTQWKDLTAPNLFEGRDLPVTIDYRDVLSELLTKQLALPSVKDVFPQFSADATRWLGLV